MTLVVVYDSKKDLKSCIGKPLMFIETSVFGPEYRSNGSITVAGRPHLTGRKREFYAVVEMKGGLIVGVE